ncbi:MAG: DUF99 family protein [Methanobacteriota archaeon]|nr:MAG: DUF99 family protein [Euryarchaeota archaeon]
MKQQVRILGVDDSPFKFGDQRSLVVGALVRVPNYLEAVLKTDVEVDGTDSTDRVVEMISRSRYKDQIRAVMIDGIAFAGFNVLDIEDLSRRTALPVLTVTRDMPDMGEIRNALKKHFDDWQRRLELVTRLGLERVKTAHKPLYACGVGLDWKEFEELVAISTVRGVVPEPVRIAHLIASGVARGESYGRS